MTSLQTSLLDMYWQRFQRILRLVRKHHNKLNVGGIRLLERARIVTFDDYADTQRELTR